MKHKFQTLSSIKPESSSSWDNKIFLTFDTDWAHDEVILDSYAIVAKAGCRSTWFITNESDSLKTLRADPRIEIGMHPNFNALLNTGGSDNSRNILKTMRKFLPEATCVRSHSLAQSERLIDEFIDIGLTHASNVFIPYQSSVKAAPFCLWGGMVVVPHQFQDNVEVRMSWRSFSEENFRKGFHVFDFHPIHVFLNTESLNRYEQTRPLHQNPKELLRHRYNGYGTRSRLIELLELSKGP
jgi:hypothetical protein